MFRSVISSLSAAWSGLALAPVQFVRPVLLCIGLLWSNQVSAHHPSHFAGPGPGRYSVPGSALELVSTVNRAEVGRRDRVVSELTAELSLVSGRLSLFGTVPYEYYRQHDRGDAARYGRPKVGLRALLGGWDLLGLKIQIAGRTRLSMQMSGDTSRFTAEPFSDIEFGGTVRVERGRWHAYLDSAGAVPVGGLAPNPVSEESLPWESSPESVGNTSHSLKKTAAVEAGFGLRILSEAYLTVGVLYREPYGGPLQEHAVADIVPGRYREWRLAANVQTKSGWTLYAAYGRPDVRFSEPGLSDQAARALRGLAPEQPREPRLRLYLETYSLGLRRAL